LILQPDHSPSTVIAVVPKCPSGVWECFRITMTLKEGNVHKNSTYRTSYYKKTGSPAENLFGTPLNKI